ncbi:unnamed protein product [Rotaria sordida]|uniref:Uncharacterized protein n=1 Tax=Rotaria sordida TaxID=392033 RepID=A0A815XN28_9BILA|nr:unnamed protein product [Rotaria sordida]CAF4269437.1 unnamed protein product [Rotaria sordida]
MDTYTPDVSGAVEFNDYMVENFVDCDSSLFSIDLWNVNKLIEEKYPRTNNHMEGHNNRMKTVFPVHPHIYEFIRSLPEEHIFQQHQAEESRVQARKRRKGYDDIGLLLEDLLKQVSDGQISQMDLAIKCGLAVKTTYVK